MNSIIYNPQEEYDTKFKSVHAKNTEQFFDELTKASNVNIEENRQTVKEFDVLNAKTAKLRKSLTLWKILRVLMIITLILIPLVILKINSKIKALKEQISNADAKSNELLAKANAQVAPLICLFKSEHCLSLIEKTLPLIDFKPCFTVEDEMNMRVNFDFDPYTNHEVSTLDLLYGDYNGNPFLFETRLNHTLGYETYHGYKTIRWTETYRDSNGKTQRRTRTQTLHATVSKPKPFYTTQVLLNYCAQGGPELSFTRDATNLDEKSERQLEKYIKKGEKRLDKLNDEAIKQNDDFMSMSNTEFEVLFDALDRTNEVQFRTLFTPLAQTNMVDILLSKTAYGDDFAFIKNKRTNTIISNHSQGRALYIPTSTYCSHSYDVIKEKYLTLNEEYFKSVYFDFAPLLAIPMYQDKPVHSLEPIPDYEQHYSVKECESLTNAVNPENFAHPSSKTTAILKSTYEKTEQNADAFLVTAYSYDIEGRVDYVSVFGGDGRFHSVAVPWDCYIPLENCGRFYVTGSNNLPQSNILGQKNNIAIYK